MKSPPKLSTYGDYSLKQRSTVECLGCNLVQILMESPWLAEFLKRLTLSQISYGGKATISIIHL